MIKSQIMQLIRKSIALEWINLLLPDHSTSQSQFISLIHKVIIFMLFSGLKIADHFKIKLIAVLRCVLKGIPFNAANCIIIKYATRYIMSRESELFPTNNIRSRYCSNFEFKCKSSFDGQTHIHTKSNKITFHAIIEYIGKANWNVTTTTE